MPSRQEQNLLERAERVLPGGSLGNLRLKDGNAFIVKRGRGSRIWDMSGNEYIDFLLGSGPMILGHAHPAVRAAVEDALSRGSSFFTQNETAVLLAEELVRAVPCAEQVRFTTSGTEATFQALRLARAFRGRDKVLKFEGGFHGMHDYGMMSVWPRQPAAYPQPVSSSAGIPQVIAETVLVAPFNDLETTTAIVEHHHDELAAIIVEPVQRVLRPVPGFLQGLRDLSAHYQLPLVFDEVVTGFRLAYGGAQEYYGIVPDLAALGKIMGGGFALGAVVGRRELMEAYDAEASVSETFVPQIGTLNGSPVAAAAGLATLAELRQPARYDAFRAAGATLRESLERLLAEAELPAVVSGVDTLFDVYFTDHPITDYRSTLRANQSLSADFDRALLAGGVFKPSGKIYVGMCHTAEDIELAIAAFENAIAAIRSQGANSP